MTSRDLTLVDRLMGRSRFDVDCDVEVRNTHESLGADVRLAGDLPLFPGDAVLVHGEPIVLPYGAHETFARRATVTRAGWVERLWTRATGDFEFMELCEFSFSEEVRL